MASPLGSLKCLRPLAGSLLIPGDEVHGGRLEPPLDLPLDVPSFPSLLKIRYTSNLALWPRENPTLSSEQQVERIEHICSPRDQQIQSARSNRRDNSSARLFSVATQTMTLKAMSKWGKFYSKWRNESISLQTHALHCYTHITISHKWSVVWKLSVYEQVLVLLRCETTSWSHNLSSSIISTSKPWVPDALDPHLPPP